MKLNSFLKFYGISNKQFSKNLGISNVSLSRYISGDRLPNSKILNRIYLLTDGLVDANDFFLTNKKPEDLTQIQKEKLINLKNELQFGKKKFIAKAITLVESSLVQHRLESNFLLSLFKQRENTIRIGITGVPGVGKSTFIESLGMELIKKNLKVAVLAVDPSSERSGGSILGDKTRMMNLSVDKNAFIRPSPSQGHLGGVAKKTSESIRCLEEAGYDIIFIETMGVGQAEISVYDMVDIFLVLLLPSGGDELQGIKKGIIEIADLIIVNKSDGNLAKAATSTKMEYKNALTMISKSRKDFSPEVIDCSSIEGKGIQEVWSHINKFISVRRKSGNFQSTRKRQKIKALWNDINLRINDKIDRDLKSKNFVKKIIKDVENNKFDVNNASNIIFDYLSNC